MANSFGTILESSFNMKNLAIILLLFLSTTVFSQQTDKIPSQLLGSWKFSHPLNTEAEYMLIYKRTDPEAKGSVYTINNDASFVIKLYDNPRRHCGNVTPRLSKGTLLFDSKTNTLQFWNKHRQNTTNWELAYVDPNTIGIKARRPL